jgi:Zn finger protein HypA/HybF involved in hydrogenase expression
MMQLHPTNAKLSLKTYLNFALTYYTNNVLRQENKMVNGYCSDCGEQYALDALDLDLRCASCVEQWATDLRQEMK